MTHRPNEINLCPKKGSALDLIKEPVNPGPRELEDTPFVVVDDAPLEPLFAEPNPDLEVELPSGREVRPESDAGLLAQIESVFDADPEPEVAAHPEPAQATPARPAAKSVPRPRKQATEPRDFIIRYRGVFLGHFRSAGRIMNRSAFQIVARQLQGKLGEGFQLEHLELYKPIPLEVSRPDTFDEISQGSFSWFSSPELGRLTSEIANPS